MRIRAVTTLLLFVFLAMFSSRASAVLLEDGYLKYPEGGLMFKLPVGNWEIVKKVPAPYDAFSVGT